MKGRTHMAIPNSDFVPDEFFPGLASAGNLAPGTDPSRSASADSISTTITSPTGASQDRYTASSSTVQPGQNDDDVLTGVTTEFITHTGAGSGSASHYPRRPGQQAAS
jgi:hypothetical protein